MCNGTCFVEDLPGATEVGTIYIDTEPREVDEIAQYAPSYYDNESKVLELVRLILVLLTPSLE